MLDPIVPLARPVVEGMKGVILLHVPQGGDAGEIDYKKQ